MLIELAQRAARQGGAADGRDASTARSPRSPARRRASARRRRWRSRRAGAAVALGARREDRLTRAREADRGRRRASAAAIEVDVGDEASARAFVERAHSELGGLDMLVNNAGVMLLGPIEGADIEDWRRMVDVNVLGLLYCTHAALPLHARGRRRRHRERLVGGGPLRGRRAAASTTSRSSAWARSPRRCARRSVPSKIRVTSSSRATSRPSCRATTSTRPCSRTIEKARKKIGDLLQAEDIADGIAYAVTQPPHVAVNEVLDPAHGPGALAQARRGYDVESLSGSRKTFFRHGGVMPVVQRRYGARSTDSIGTSRRPRRRGRALVDVDARVAPAVALARPARRMRRRGGDRLALALARSGMCPGVAAARHARPAGPRRSTCSCSGSACSHW